MIEVQDIFSEYGPGFQESHPLPCYQRKAMDHIISCRTSALGGHLDQCDSCGHFHISYNSCRDRHCPKCQNLARERWLVNREQELLDVGYFHIVFTVPAALRPLALRNQKAVYNILFRAASESLRELAADPKYLGANIGMLCILHTWGQNLMDHPHLHCLVPGGGLSSDGNRWIHASKKFFIPVKVLSRKFRGKFLALLKTVASDNMLQFHGQISYLCDSPRWQELIDNLYHSEWVVYCKKPFASSAHVLRYLGRYTHRVAISNHRIVSTENGLVTFKYRDYRDKDKYKLMTVTAAEFIRRFLLHILPPGFVKIRYYGIFANRVRKAKVKQSQKLLGMKQCQPPKLSTIDLIIRLTGIDPRFCPSCKQGHLKQVMSFSPIHAPPNMVQ